VHGGVQLLHLLSFSSTKVQILTRAQVCLAAEDASVEVCVRALQEVEWELKGAEETLARESKDVLLAAARVHALADEEYARKRAVVAARAVAAGTLNFTCSTGTKVHILTLLTLLLLLQTRA